MADEDKPVSFNSTLPSDSRESVEPTQVVEPASAGRMKREAKKVERLTVESSDKDKDEFKVAPVRCPVCVCVGAQRC